MTPIFCQFMVRHSSALSRFAQLEANATPTMKQYLEDTKTISMAHSNAWNLSSLLIKPVQRFTKYPLLLAAIVDATSEEHPDYQNLLSAKSMMLDAVKKVNEDSRRRDVVRAVLEGKGLKGVVATIAPAASAASTALATTGSVGKIKSLRSGFSVGKKDKDKDKDKDKGVVEEDTAVNGPNGAVSPGLNGSFDDAGPDKTPGGALDDLHKRLKEFDVMIPRYTSEVILWVKSVRETLGRLEAWALAFERVIALSDEGGIEALQAFRNVLADRLTGVIDALVSTDLNGLRLTNLSIVGQCYSRHPDSFTGETHEYDERASRPAADRCHLAFVLCSAPQCTIWRQERKAPAIPCGHLRCVYRPGRTTLHRTSGLPQTT